MLQVFADSKSTLSVSATCEDSLILGIITCIIRPLHVLMFSISVTCYAVSSALREFLGTFPFYCACDLFIGSLTHSLLGGQKNVLSWDDKLLIIPNDDKFLPRWALQIKHWKSLNWILTGSNPEAGALQLLFACCAFIAGQIHLRTFLWLQLLSAILKLRLAIRRHTTYPNDIID